MIQDIGPKRLYNEYAPIESTPDDYIMAFQKNRVLLKEIDKHVEIPTKSELLAALKAQDSKISSSQYLFCIDKDRYFLYPGYEQWEEQLNPAEAKLRLMKITDLRWQADREICYAVYTAYHLYQWYRSSRFCGRCGAKTVPDQKERMLYCEKCGNQIYPRISPAVIAAVTNGDKILLTKYANREYKRYALIAGFTEIGETAEDTVRREVMEEAGIRVKNIRYYKSQPWGIDGNILFGYFAELDGDDTIAIDENELAFAEWVRRDELKDMDDSFSLTREMMRVFYEKDW